MNVGVVHDRLPDEVRFERHWCTPIGAPTLFVGVGVGVSTTLLTYLVTYDIILAGFSLMICFLLFLLLFFDRKMPLRKMPSFPPHSQPRALRHTNCIPPYSDFFCFFLRIFMH